MKQAWMLADVGRLCEWVLLSLFALRVLSLLSAMQRAVSSALQRAACSLFFRPALYNRLNERA